MNRDAVLMESIRRDAERADALQREGRELLVDAVHRAVAAGFTQRDIARAVRRSQPEVSRLAHQTVPGPLARRVRERRQEALRTLDDYGVTNARIFGSVASGAEKESSDIDVLIDTPRPLGLMTLARLESALSDVFGARVDVVPASGLPDHVRERILAEAVPL